MMLYEEPTAGDEASREASETGGYIDLLYEFLLSYFLFISFFFYRGKRREEGEGRVSEAVGNPVTSTAVGDPVTSGVSHFG